MVAQKVKVDQYFNIDLFSDINKTDKDGVSPLHDAVTTCTDTVRQSGSRYYVDGEVNTVVAPVTTALSTDNIGGDINPSYGMQVSGTHFISGLPVLLAYCEQGVNEDLLGNSAI